MHTSWVKRLCEELGEFAKPVSIHSDYERPASNGISFLVLWGGGEDQQFSLHWIKCNRESFLVALHPICSGSK